MSNSCVYLRPLYWKVIDATDYESHDTILIYGRDNLDRTVGVKVVKCSSYFYIKTNLHITSEHVARKLEAAIFDKIVETVDKRNDSDWGMKNPIDAPESIVLEELENLRSLQSLDDGRRKMWYIKVTTGSSRSKYRLKWHILNKRRGDPVNKPGMMMVSYELNNIMKKIKIELLGTAEVNSVTPLLQFATDRNLSMANWIKIREPVEIPDGYLREFTVEKEHSYVDLNIVTTPDCVSNVGEDDDKVSDSLNIDPVILSFDLEADSKHVNSMMPKGFEIDSTITSICFRVGRHNTPAGEWKGVALCLGECPETQNDYRVLTFDTERALLLAFADQINYYDPDLITGYNIFGFDWKFIDKRCIIHDIRDEFMSFGRYKYLNRDNPDKTCGIIKIQWNSSAYGNQSNIIFDAIGRLQLDVMLEFKVTLGLKLDTFRLDEVAFVNLGLRKEDLPIPELFRILGYRRCLLENWDMKTSDLKKKICNLFPEFEVVGGVKQVRDLVLLSRTKLEIKNSISFGVDLANKYCDTDAMLPGLLIQNNRLFLNAQELSNIRGVPIDYHSIRGQGIKTLSTIYPYIKKQGYIIPDLIEKVERANYKGAVVLTAIPGHHKEMAVLDYASLYPCAMIDKNLCITTIVLENSQLSPEKLRKLYDPKDHRFIKIERDEEDESKSTKGKPVLSKKVYYHVFVKQHVRKGIFPAFLEVFLAKRSLVKKMMGETSDKTLKIVYFLRQLALKIACNSSYGILADRDSIFCEKSVAESITAAGREYLIQACDYIDTNYPGIQVVYGDSVTHDTPVVLRQNGKIFIRTMDNLPCSSWKTSVDGKEYADTIENLEVWTEDGFTPIVHVMKHKTHKQLFRITSHTGSIIVTEDHSLLNIEKEIVKPSELEVGSTILTHVQPELKGDLVISDAWSWGIKCAKDHVKIPDKIFSCCVETRRNFFDGYFLGVAHLHKDRGIIFASESQIDSQQLYLLAASVGHELELVVSGKEYMIKPLSNRVVSVKPGKIMKIEPWGTTENYVYDLETGNHHFGAGVGQIIAHNTDSTMIKYVDKEYFDGITRPQRIEISKRIAKEVSDVLGGPMQLNFENYFTDFVQIQKKNYVAEIWEEYRKGDLDKIRVLFQNIKKDGFDLASKGNVEVKAVVDFLIKSDNFEITSYEDVLSCSDLNELFDNYVKFCENGRIVSRLWKGVLSKKRGYAHFTKRVYREIIELIMGGKYSLNKISDLIANIATESLFMSKDPDIKDLLISRNIQPSQEYSDVGAGVGKMMAARIAMEERNVELPARLNCVDVIRDPNLMSEEEREVFLDSKGEVYKGAKSEDVIYYIYNKDRLKLRIDKFNYLETLTKTSFNGLFNAVLEYDRFYAPKPKEEFARLIKKVKELVEEDGLDTQFISNLVFLAPIDIARDLQYELTMGKKKSSCSKTAKDAQTTQVRPYGEHRTISLTQKRNKDVDDEFTLLGIDDKKLAQDLKDSLSKVHTWYNLRRLNIHKGGNGLRAPESTRGYTNDEHGKRYRLKDSRFIHILCDQYRYKDYLCRELKHRRHNMPDFRLFMA